LGIFREPLLYDQVLYKEVKKVVHPAGLLVVYSIIAIPYQNIYYKKYVYNVFLIDVTQLSCYS
jgi:hypothetical protein